MARRRTDFGWYFVFALLAGLAFFGVYFLSGEDAFGAAGLIVWNGAVFLFNAAARLLASFSALIARGVGFRRLARTITQMGGIGIGYAGSVFFSDEKIAKVHDWRDRLRASLRRVGEHWRALSLPVKLVIVAVMITAQLSLHWVLIVFPIGFLVPVVRRAWVQAADTAFGTWYWRTFGAWHRAAIQQGRQLPVLRQVIGAFRLTRLRYLTAWRLWRHDPRYRIDESGGRMVDFIEPFRLWWRGELDHYVGRSLLGGRSGDGRQEIGYGAEK